MASEDKQYTFRLPQKLVTRVDKCTKQMQRSGLSVNRTDIIRMLLTRALNSLPECEPEAMLAAGRPTA